MNFDLNVPLVVGFGVLNLASVLGIPLHAIFKLTPLRERLGSRTVSLAHERFTSAGLE